ncbi:winged helix-turn-helix transcriptional regulator [Lactococcus kimchii]|uniref:winged helix-turn-helix transcriptional regulator n=1 Tax=Lactococcus sp. S-13 TaxID=2507158 RepID=UPI001022E8AC|nr:helix-turn-helix domain-containing protein [Lactococcus sp. S-13]RZI48122.1 transcriptional regulator [Lactococcus sp. S-13]
MSEKIYNIAVEATMEVIGGKWKPIILCNLRHGAVRPGELKRQISGISQKMLTQQLKELESAHIVTRKSYNEVPPRVEYSLSEYGESLSTIMDSLCDWGKLHIQTLKNQGQSVTLLQD